MEVEISIQSNITAEQIVTTLAAIPAFLPVTVCSGYLAAWLTNLHGFRQRSLVERFFWSVPLSLAISTIAFVLVGKFLSLGVCAALSILCLFGCVAVLAQEWNQMRRSGRNWNVGIQPLGGTVLVLSVVWVAFVILTLVDYQSNQRLFMSLTFYDIGARVDWANSVLNSGIPPANPHYFYLHPANLRYYYFWLVDCAVAARISHLPMRSVVGAGCVWSGFILEALTGLYLKYFLAVGARLRRQFRVALLLPAVGSLSLCIYFWNMLYLHIPPPGDVWSPAQIADLVNFFLFYPHHLASMVCCMFAFLLAWMSPGASGQRPDCKRHLHLPGPGQLVRAVGLRCIRIFPGDGVLGAVAGSLQTRLACAGSAFCRGRRCRCPARSISLRDHTYRVENGRRRYRQRRWQPLHVERSRNHPA